jgi:FkbM family methyltransferase
MIGRKSAMDRDLIFDIGLHNGDDTAYYLHLGYRVLGVEANPLLASQCTRRFENEIRQGHARIINAGVLKEPGEFTFYRSLRDDSWSSFDPEKGKKEGEWQEMKVPCVTTQQLIAEHGKPFFMKVDIEGTDLQALHSITPATAPTYISLELNCDDPIVESLIELGYSAFKFVNGETYRSNPEIFDHQVTWRLVRKVGRVVPFVRNAISRLPQRLRAKSEYDPPGKFSPDGYPFGRHSSGPFGEHADGPWLTGSAALGWLADLKKHYRRAGMETSFWWDVQARHSSSPARM